MEGDVFKFEFEDIQWLFAKLKICQPFSFGLWGNPLKEQRTKNSWLLSKVSLA